MKQKLFTFLSFLGLFLGVLSPIYSDQVKDPATNVSFPSDVSFKEGSKNYNLKLTGIATRQKFFLKIYSVAHYIENPENFSSDQEALNFVLNDTSRAKQLSMHWVRGISLEKLREAYSEGIQKTLSPEQFQSLQNEINTFLNLFNKGSKAGDIYTLRWLPKGKLILDVNGDRIGEIVNTVFAKAVWEIWLGTHSVVKRDNLISNLITSH